MSRTVAWRNDTPVTETDIAYQILTTGGEELKETVYHYLLRQELTRIAHDEGVVADPKAVAARLTALEEVEGFAATLELMEIDADRFAQELADEELVAAWLETEEPVEEGAVTALYEKEYRGRMKEASTRMRHILIETAPDAREKIERIADEGASFESKAERYSACPSASAGGDLGWMRKEEVLPEFAPLFDLAPGSDPVIVETELGVHLVEVTDQQEPTPLPPEEGVRIARSHVAHVARKERLSGLLRQLRQEVRFAEETN